MQRLARDGYTYYSTKDPMDNGGLSGVCSKNATSMPPLLCITDQAETWADKLLAAWLLQGQQFLTDLLLSKKPCMVAESEVNVG